MLKNSISIQACQIMTGVVAHLRPENFLSWRGIQVTSYWMSTLVIHALSRRNREIKVDIQGLGKISIKWIVLSQKMFQNT